MNKPCMNHQEAVAIRLVGAAAHVQVSIWLPWFSEYVEDGHDGILIEPRRSTELIQSIRYLIEDEQARKKLERNAREKDLQYDWKIIMDRYRRIYGEFL